MNKVLLIGKPNSGKSLLFNRLTGLQQKVANFPGVTVEVKSGAWGDYELLDFPGSYSFSPLTQDESVAVDELHRAINEGGTKAVMCVLDAVQLERSLVFALQALEFCRRQNKPMIVLLNMYDELQAQSLSLDATGLARELGTPVYLVSGKTRFGLNALYEAVGLSKTPSTSVEISASELAKKYSMVGDVFIRKINALDRIFLSTFGGGIIFLGVMFVIFQAIFSWAAPLMDGVESLIALMGELVSSGLPEGMVRDFVNDAIFGGVGSFVVFVPQIFVLTFLIGILEDTGYLARVAIICHRPLKFFGLSGKSFIPFLSGHACAIPAIYASRMIESPKKRLITILTIPLISCSARLPVYALFISAIIPETAAWGVVNMRGVAFFLLFIFGYVVALLVSALYSKYIYKNKSDAPFMIELPSYRQPPLRPLLQKSLLSSWRFLKGAGPIIFVVSVVIWVLGYFPSGTGHLDSSWIASIGRWIEPVVAPFDLDWRYGVAILMSFLAREVFVGTLGTLYGIEGADEEIVPLATQLQADGLSLATGVALLVFYVVALQCVSTLAVIGRETGSKTLPVYVFIFYTLLAYVLSLLTYVIIA